MVNGRTVAFSSNIKALMVNPQKVREIHATPITRTVLVAGATGYIGGRLVPRLLESDYRVRVMGRDEARLQSRPWSAQVESMTGDVLQPESLNPAVAGVDVAYYLIHSMGAGEGFHNRDIDAARNFAYAAKGAGIRRIIYLGGLGDPDSALSKHLRSRQDTGEALRSGGVPVTEFRAGIIVGSGSLSFEMVRNLTERLPVMIAPRWVYTRVQPIGIRDVLTYLVRTLDTPESVGHIIEIGGADVLTYADMMLEYAKERGLRRLIIPVPVLTPRLSSYWVHWMTPVTAEIARPLIEGLRNEVVVCDEIARQIFPDIHPSTYRQALRRTLERLRTPKIESAWSDALVSSQESEPVTLTLEEGVIIEQRRRRVLAPADGVFHQIQTLGGSRGWLYWDWAWSLRGAIDRLLGGVGLRRGRRDPVDLRLGDAVDFWRVEVLEAPLRLRLRAEMKVPGKAWLQFDVESLGENASQLIQTAYFVPKGLSGLLYWYALYPLHKRIFSGMANAILQEAEIAFQNVSSLKLRKT